MATPSFRLGRTSQLAGVIVAKMTPRCILADLQIHADYAPAWDLREFARAVLPEADRLAVTMSSGS